MRTYRQTKQSIGTVLFAAVAVILLSFPNGIARGQAADLILHHGKIVTVDSKFSIQQALAVKNGQIIEIGSNASVLKRKGPGTRMFDLKGKTVLPGLMD